MKCELEYQDYKYCVLKQPDQLEHHRKTKPAFAALLELAKDPAAYKVYVDGHLTAVHGAVLVWGAATEEGKSAVRAEYGFADVLTLSDMIRNLNTWNHPGYRDLIEKRRLWCNELFDGLLNISAPQALSPAGETLADISNEDGNLRKP